MSQEQTTLLDLLPDSIKVALIVTGKLEELGVSYLIGGSVASIIHGIPRLTQDVDLVADIREEQVSKLVSAFEEDFYIDEQAVSRAVRTRASFNMIYLDKMYKVDVFIPKGDTWSKEGMQQRQLKPLLADEDSTARYISNPETTVLQKLLWFKKGGGISEKQWDDILGVLKVQSDSLDYEYLRRWASELGVADLLSKALADAGSTDSQLA
ncbi:MAG: hypothetical protein SF097_26505 [Acidobacteriota bacterium]|nr:hypothetical protein [Acidobacteriota bacterium]